LKLAVFWDVTCSLLDIDRVSQVLTAATIIVALKMEAVSTPETSINFHQTAWHNIPKDSHLHKKSTLEEFV
jgi:hypothetical protein